MKEGLLHHVPMLSVEKSIGKVSTEKQEPLIYTETCANHKNKK